MKVRMLQQLSGARDGQPWPAPGTEVDVPDAEGRTLIRNGTAEDPGADHPKVLVPPAGIHTPGTVAYSEPGVVDLVEVPADALTDAEGVKAALKARESGDTTQVPAGTGVQAPSGAALTAEQVQESVEADEVAREDFGGPKATRPRAGAKSSDKTTKS